ncbi:hypothetical protein JCM15579A_19980 [Marinifilum fragile]
MYVIDDFLIGKGSRKCIQNVFPVKTTFRCSMNVKNFNIPIFNQDPQQLYNANREPQSIHQFGCKPMRNQNLKVGHVF